MQFDTAALRPPADPTIADEDVVDLRPSSTASDHRRKRLSRRRRIQRFFDQRQLQLGIGNVKRL